MRLGTTLVALLAGCGAGCGAGEQPQGVPGGAAAPALRIDLSRAKCNGELLSGALVAGVRAVHEGVDLWLVASIPRSAWTEGAQPGRFRTRLPVLRVGTPREGGAPWRLRAKGGEFEYEADTQRLGERPNRFATGAGRIGLELALEPDALPPESAELWAVVDYEEVGDGPRRLRGRRVSGDGIWVPSGLVRTLELSVPAGSSLRFATVVEPLLGRRTQPQDAYVFRLRLDGELIFEHTLEVGALGEALAWHSLALPAQGLLQARLQLEVQGPLALTSFLAPRTGPSAYGSYSARPFEQEQPDVVVFLADTLRADSLEAYGGSLGLTPEIDRFAADARVFARAWSTSTHTLPAHSSMFSGTYPPQNGQLDISNPLPAAVVTLAERLLALGYRCGAVTDGVMVSVRHGLAQGFEIFDERRGESTLERVRSFLDADDGRPIFLFVQSYAAHTPYTISAATHADWRERLALERSYEDVHAALMALPRLPEEPPSSEPALEVARRLRDLYRAAVVELDGIFGSVRAELERRSLIPRGVLLLASDHGEAFLEHGRPFHTNRVFEEELRVPLILQGPGVMPGREERAVSLIDFAPTLAALVGLPVPGHWEGRSLLEPVEERTLYAFQARYDEERSTMAVIRGARKLIGYEDLAALEAGALHAAFDLESDPRELRNLLTLETWPATLLEAERGQLKRLMTPLVEAEALVHSGAVLEGLKAMGYAGGE